LVGLKAWIGAALKGSTMVVLKAIWTVAQKGELAVVY
jgi:hypothetical protein